MFNIKEPHFFNMFNPFLKKGDVERCEAIRLHELVDHIDHRIKAADKDEVASLNLARRNLLAEMDNLAAVCPDEDVRREIIARRKLLSKVGK